MFLKINRDKNINFLLFFWLLFVLTGNVFSQDIIVKALLNPDKAAPGDRAVIEVFYSFPEGMHQTLQEDYFFFSIDSPSNIKMDDIEYPEGVKEDGLINYYDNATLKSSIIIPSNMPPGNYSLKITASYQLCENNGACYFPQEIKLSIPFEATDIKSDNITLLLILKFLLMAFTGGLILNIMPCVLPVLSIKALNLVKQSSYNRKKIFKGSLLYTAGIIGSLLILAITVIILKFSGEMIGWGFQFQNTKFILVLLSIIFLFALSLFDVFIVTAPGMNIAARAASTGGDSGSFLSGIFAVLLATPCSAPFLGTALGFAFSQPPFMIILIFLFIGLGLASPFLLLGFWPGFLKKIPKPGAWMNVFKEMMGFLLIATAIWLLNVLFHQTGGANLIKILIYLMFLGIAAWIYGKFGTPASSRKKQWISLVIALLIVIISAGVLLRFEQNTGEEAAVQTNINSGREDFSPERLEEYLSAGTPVFIDFSAEWCMTCKVNETVLLTDEIKELFKHHNIKLLYADYTNKNRLIASWIAGFGKGGVPVYVFYPPWTAAPVILPEFLTKKIIIDVIKKYF